MSDSAAGAHDSELGRRWLLRGGAVAAGAAVLAAAAPSVTAQAADGDPANLGEDNDATTTTRFSLSGTAAATSATVALQNADGPTLYLEPSASWETPPVLEMGQIANTILGPVIGVDSFNAGLVTSYLATGVDLDDLPTPYALPKPVRLLDTRTVAGRAGILRMSAGALDATGQLKPLQWIDVELAVEDGPLDVPAAHLNVVAISDRAGYMKVYPPGPPPGTSTLNFPAKQPTANAAFVATSIVLGRYAVRLTTSVLTHLVLDLSGVTIKGRAAVPTAAKAQSQAQAQNRTKSQGPSQGRRTRLAERFLSRLSR